MPAQSIDLPGVNNARELGGYAIGTRHVKHDTLIRCASLATASDEAIRRLGDKYHVQTVVDLRMSFEAQRDPDPTVGNARNVHLSVIEMQDYPIPEDFDTSKLALLDDMSGNRMALFEIAWDLGTIGPNMYCDFLLKERGIRAYARFFEELKSLDEGRAILWHCTDGKDRTGCAAALLLFALGATREQVLHDYLLTNDYNARTLEAVRARVADVPMADDKREALVFMSGGVIAGYLERALEAIDERYGSMAAYLRDELGVGDAETEALRERFLV